MKILLILVAVSLSGGEKLDRSYLPPPGAHLSGGVFEDDKLQLPKDNYHNDAYESIDSESTFNTTPDDRNTIYDGNIQVVTSTPGSLHNTYNNPSSTAIPSLMFTQTTNIPVEYRTSTPKTPTSYQYNHELHEPVVISNPRMSIQDVIQSVSIPKAASKVTKVISMHSNESTSTDLDKEIEPSKMINSMEKGFIEKIPHDYDISSTQKMPFSAIGKDSLKSMVFPIQTSQGIDTSVKYPARLRDAIDKNAITFNYENNYIPGGFSYSFDTSNGIHADESGTADNGVKAKGSYSYIGDDGMVYKIEYTADENGFQPRGNHLPTSPPIPKEIQRVIEQAYKNKAAGKFDDGSYDDKKYGYKKYMPRLTHKAKGSKIGNSPQKDMDTEYGKRRLQISTERNPTYEDGNNAYSGNPIHETSQNYNYETSTPSLTSNTVSSPDGYKNTISPVKSTYVTPATFVTRLYTSRILADSDESNTPKDDIYKSTTSEYFTTPVTTTLLTGTESYISEFPDRSPTEGNSFREDFSGPNQNQNFDPNTGYYY
ncbi:uncharacterized protein LOC123699324 [Colias croceus]|uniref:uncharacterized protein LOC123699324 n=1 Tax=Colias crocea TaxID=72248 RepID=UPI001E27B9A8|nr:uncharacterized protein LOC123699324 [Colias croceus]